MSERSAGQRGGPMSTAVPGTARMSDRHRRVIARKADVLSEQREAADRARLAAKAAATGADDALRAPLGTVGNRDQRRYESRVVAQHERHAPAAEPPLGTSQSYRPTDGDQRIRAVPPEVAEARTVKRWGQLHGLRSRSSKKRVRKCKTVIGNGHVGLVANGGGSHFTGLESCGNIWVCPVCGPKIRASRTNDVLLAFDRHAANGGGFAFLTLTVQHEHGEALAMLLGVLGGAWKSVAEQREYKEWKQRLGMIGSITALEVTDGVNSWHPHRHVMLLTERPLSRNEVEAFEAVLDELYGRWITKQGRKRGGLDARTGRRVGVRLEYVAPGKREQLGRYITKLQAGFELTRGDLKQSRAAADGKGRLPFDILDEAMAGGEGADQALARWREYEQAMTGKSAVRFSKGLRAHLGMEAAKTDQELAEQVVGGEADIYIRARLFRRMTRDGHRARLLLAHRRGGELAVLQLVADLYGVSFAAEDEHLRRLIVG